MEHVGGEVNHEVNDKILEQINNHPFSKEEDLELGLGQAINKQIATYIDRRADEFEQPDRFETTVPSGPRIREDRAFADILRGIAVEARSGDTKSAKDVLQNLASQDREAYRLLKAIDPDAKSPYGEEELKD